jgi:phosphatidate phosphatase APP1
MSYLRRMASSVDDWLDRRRMDVRAYEGQDEPVVVVPYRGYAANGRIWLRGTVVERSKMEKPALSGGLLEDLAVTIGRFTAEEIMGATVRVEYDGASTVCTTDSDGFFFAEFDAPVGTGWQEALVTLEDFPGREQPPVSVAGEFLAPHPDATIGIISDIDDTVIRTGISRPLQNIRTIVESDPESRVAFPGLAPLYQSLQHGAGGDRAVNPVFYVSSGSWRLYDLIVRFKALNGIPRGPMFMDDWGIDETRWFKSSHGAHKTRTIDTILAAYPDLGFILVGDSGQHDAEIYAKAVRDHGSRIKSIWIRDVSDDARDAEVREVVREAQDAGVPVFAEPDLAEAAADAANRGWIDAEDLAAVRRAISEAAKTPA